jgi:hypothetical protein
MPHHALRRLAINAKTTASADVAVYIANAFSYPIIAAWRAISFANLARPGTGRFWRPFALSLAGNNSGVTCAGHRAEEYGQRLLPAPRTYKPDGVASRS